jgi:hypothetical protein
MFLFKWGMCIFMFNVYFYVFQRSAIGKELFDVFVKLLDLHECDYFGLTYHDSHKRRVCYIFLFKSFTIM